ncbi:MAG: MerR family transcriptional regulator [Dehalococcoidia bacterium]|nr:MerR family transcriptional regulator [Dehalococcoidia bacterium]
METERRVAIAIASETLSLHPQTLRKYERAGLLRPERRGGGSRQYSQADIERLSLIKHLAEVRRVNVAGMALALAMHDDLLALLAELEGVDDARTHARERIAQVLARLVGD